MDVFSQIALALSFLILKSSAGPIIRPLPTVVNDNPSVPDGGILVARTPEPAYYPNGGSPEDLDQCETAATDSFDAIQEGTFLSEAADSVHYPEDDTMGNSDPHIPMVTDPVNPADSYLNQRGMTIVISPYSSTPETILLPRTDKPSISTGWTKTLDPIPTSLMPTYILLAPGSEPGPGVSVAESGKTYNVPTAPPETTTTTPPTETVDENTVLLSSPTEPFPSGTGNPDSNINGGGKITDYVEGPRDKSYTNKITSVVPTVVTTSTMPSSMLEDYRGFYSFLVSNSYFTTSTEPAKPNPTQSQSAPEGYNPLLEGGKLFSSFKNNIQSGTTGSPPPPPATPTGTTTPAPPPPSPAANTGTLQSQAPSSKPKETGGPQPPPPPRPLAPPATTVRVVKTVCPCHEDHTLQATTPSPPPPPPPPPAGNQLPDNCTPVRQTVTTNGLTTTVHTPACASSQVMPTKVETLIGPKISPKTQMLPVVVYVTPTLTPSLLPPVRATEAPSSVDDKSTNTEISVVPVTTTPEVPPPPPPTTTTLVRSTSTRSPVAPVTGG